MIIRSYFGSSYIRVTTSKTFGAERVSMPWVYVPLFGRSFLFPETSGKGKGKSPNKSKGKDGNYIFGKWVAVNAMYQFLAENMDVKGKGKAAGRLFGVDDNDAAGTAASSDGNEAVAGIAGTAASIDGNEAVAGIDGTDASIDGNEVDADGIEADQGENEAVAAVTDIDGNATSGMGMFYSQDRVDENIGMFELHEQVESMAVCTCRVRQALETMQQARAKFERELVTITYLEDLSD